MTRSALLIVVAANAALACSLVYDTSELRGQAGGGGNGGEPTTSSSIGGAGGAAGGPACECEPRSDLVWLVLAEGVAVDDAAPLCPRGRAEAEGALAGSLQDEATSCGGVCTGPSRVKLTIDDSCGVAGEGVDNSGSCDAKTLSPETPGDTTLAINLEPLPCTLTTPALLDTATLTRGIACAIDDDGCSPPAGTKRCIAAPAGGCLDPCFAEPAALQAVVDTRDCGGVLATCSPAVFGELELHDDAQCNGAATASWTLTGAAICPADPSPPSSPATSYWRYTPDPQDCAASAPANGTAMLVDTLIELCCAAG